MLVIELVVLWVVAAILAFAAWHSAVILSLQDPTSTTGPGARQLRSAIQALVALPLLTISALAVVVLLALQDQVLLYLSHGFVLLGLWLSAALTVLGLATSARQRKLAPVAFLGLMLALAAAVYLTPISRFQVAFSPLPLLWPLAAGAALIAVCYVALWRLWHELGAQ
jgi:hypothetical protein